MKGRVGEFGDGSGSVLAVREVVAGTRHEVGKHAL